MNSFQWQRFADPLRYDVGLDLGIQPTRIVTQNGVHAERSLCCVHLADGKRLVIAAGTAAAKHEGRVSRPVRTVQPIRNRVVSDLPAAADLLRTACEHAGVSTGVPAQLLSANSNAVAEGLLIKVS